MIIDYFDPVRAIRFDGLASYASLSAATLGLVGRTSASVSLFARRNTSFVPAVNGNNAFFSTNTNAVCKLVPSTTGAVAFYLFRDVSGVLTGTTKTGPAMTVGQWYHLLWAYDSTIGWRCWVDGAEVGSVLLAGNGFSLGAAPGLTDHYIGRHANTYLDCDVTQLSVWSTYETDPAKMRTSDGTPRDLYGQSGILGWWTLGDRYVLGSYSLRDRMGGAAFSWVNAVESTQVVAR
jgi:hypothetical protein